MSAYGDLMHVGSEMRFQLDGQPKVCLFYELASDGTQFQILEAVAIGHARQSPDSLFVFEDEWHSAEQGKTAQFTCLPC